MNNLSRRKSKINLNFRFKAFTQLSLFSLFIILCFSIPISAQFNNEEPPDDVAPPVIKRLSKPEKDALDAQNKNLKKRTKVSLELMEARLLKAEKSIVEGTYNNTLTELASFSAILDNNLDHLIENDKGKSDRSFINFEIYLRKQMPRLEAIRREMPSRYGYYVGRLMVNVREARAKAVEPIFGDPITPTASKKP